MERLKNLLQLITSKINAAIIEAADGVRNCNEIGDCIRPKIQGQIAQCSVANRLTTLLKHDILSKRKEGSQVYYSVNQELIDKLNNLEI